MKKITFHQIKSVLPMNIDNFIDNFGQAFSSYFFPRYPPEEEK